MRNKTKSRIKALAIIFIAGAFLTTGKTGSTVKASETYNLDNLYPLYTEIREVTDSHIVAEDFNGNLWEFYNDGSEDWYPDDICVMIMHNNNTPDTIYDDIIIKTRYSGYVK